MDKCEDLTGVHLLPADSSSNHAANCCATHIFILSAEKSQRKELLLLQKVDTSEEQASTKGHLRQHGCHQTPSKRK